jgi:hypothetical protein
MNLQIEPTEVLSSQNLISKCDFWFAISALDGAYRIPPTAQQVARRSNHHGDYINLFNFAALTPKSVVYCKFDYLRHLVAYLNNNRCSTPFILLTGQSDYAITDSIFDAMQSKLSVTWWGCNNECSRAHGVPLGIADDFCVLGLTAKRGLDAAKTKGNRLLYVNHRTWTRPDVREPLYPMFSDKPWATVRQPVEGGQLGSYKEELLDHKFMLCPRGNGVDTHRMWESLYCGVIPIVQRNHVHSSLERNLPILFVNSYQDVTEDLLNKTYEEFSKTTWNMNMLKSSWWIEQMKIGA